MMGRLTRRAFSVGLATAFGSVPLVEAKGEAEAMDAFDEGRLRLDLALERGEGYLLATYRVVNGGTVPLVVFDRLFVTDPRGARTVDPELSWRWVDSGGSYVIAKLVPTVPRDMRVESPEIPYARGLPAGGELVGRALVPLPLDQRLPYDREPPAPSGAEVDDVQLLLGYGVIDPEFAFNEIATPDETVLSVRPPWARSRHRVLRSETVPARLPMARSDRG